MTRRFPKTTTRREMRNHLAAYDAFYSGSTVVPVLEPKKERKNSGRQPESAVNDEVKRWANARDGVLYRNRRGMVELRSGVRLPIGLGPNGYGDLCGYLTIQITPAMVGRRVAVFAMVESKTEKGRLDDHQLQMIEEVRDAGGIAGCCRSAVDAEVMLATWSTRKL